MMLNALSFGYLKDHQLRCRFIEGNHGYFEAAEPSAYIGYLKDHHLRWLFMEVTTVTLKLQNLLQILDN
jgi:hypothetical protein